MASKPLQSLFDMFSIHPIILLIYRVNKDLACNVGKYKWMIFFIYGESCENAAEKCELE